MRNQIVTCVDCLLNLLVHVQNPVRELTILCENPSDPTLQSQHQAATTTEPEHLPCIVRPSSVDFALWERFILSIHDSLKAMLVNENSRATGLCSWLVLIDDNMQYSSMRYEYCQLARKCECRGLNVGCNSSWLAVLIIQFLCAVEPLIKDHPFV